MFLKQERPEMEEKNTLVVKKKKKGNFNKNNGKNVQVLTDSLEMA